MTEQDGRKRKNEVAIMETKTQEEVQMLRVYSEYVKEQKDNEDSKIAGEVGL